MNANQTEPPSGLPLAPCYASFLKAGWERKFQLILEMKGLKAQRKAGSLKVSYKYGYACGRFFDSMHNAEVKRGDTPD